MPEGQDASLRMHYRAAGRRLIRNTRPVSFHRDRFNGSALLGAVE